MRVMVYIFVKETIESKENLYISDCGTFIKNDEFYMNIIMILI